jgi:hypothetical protein
LVSVAAFFLQKPVQETRLARRVFTISKMAILGIPIARANRRWTLNSIAAILTEVQQSRMAILYFLGEEPIRNDQQQDCCLILEVHAPHEIDSELIRLAAAEATENEFGKRLTLWSANEEEASQHLQAVPGATKGYLELGAGVPVFWHLLPIV